MAKRRTTGQVLGERVQHYRKRAGLTQEELADRTAALGMPMNRVTIAKIEGAARDETKPADRTRADNATLVDVLALALALEVPPPLLFVSLVQGEKVELGGLRLDPFDFVQWICGEEQIANLAKFLGRPQIESGWDANAQPLTLFRFVQQRQRDVKIAEMELILAERGGRPDDVLAKFRAEFDAQLRDLDRLLTLMRNVGIDSLPEVRPEWVVRMAELRLSEESDRP